MRNTSILAVLLVIIGLGSLLGGFVYMTFAARSNQQTAWQQSQYPQPQQGYQQGPMGGYGGMMGPGIGQRTVSAGQPVAIQQAIQEMRNIPAYANVISSNNTIVFNSKDFSVVVLALMADDAVNLTGMQPPSYATGDVFVIYGLINPTIVVRAGASIQFTMVNLDDDMYHNMIVSSYGPPYGYMSMQGMMSGNWMPYLPPADYAQGSAQQYSYTLNMSHPGTFWYLCTYEGHAQSGMYGQLIVTG
jgi:rusticyanin